MQSEEEIIKNLNELISWKGKNVEIRDYEIEAIQNLLDLYNNQKERIKELEEKLVDKICRGVEEEVLEEYRQRIKELEEIEKEHREENGKLREELNKYIVQLTDEQYRRLVDIIRDEINKEWKDKIKAKIEELKSNKDFDMDVYVEEFAVDVLQELLEE